MCAASSTVFSPSHPPLSLSLPPCRSSCLCECFHGAAAGGSCPRRPPPPQQSSPPPPPSPFLHVIHPAFTSLSLAQLQVVAAPDVCRLLNSLFSPSPPPYSLPLPPCRPSSLCVPFIGAAAGGSCPGCPPGSPQRREPWSCSSHRPCLGNPAFPSAAASAGTSHLSSGICG